MDTLNKTLLLDDGNILLYNDLISTIPLSILNNIADLGLDKIHDMASFDTTFISTNYIPGLGEPIIDYAYIYVSDLLLPYHRITVLEDSRYILEYRSDRVPPPGLLNFSSVKTPGARLVHDINLDSVFGIKLIGRYAQWTHKCKTEDVIRRAKEYAKQR